MLGQLDERQRDLLVSAMADVERLLCISAIEVCLETPTTQDARRCLDEYFKELSQRFETGFDPARSNSATDAEMMPPAGCFVLARLDGDPVGCGALKCKDAAVGGIKRMWTDPSARGLGVARRILRTLESIARDRGLAVLRLETNRALLEAQALYRSEGYEEVARFNEEPYAHHWFEKML